MKCKHRKVLLIYGATTTTLILRRFCEAKASKDGDGAPRWPPSFEARHEARTRLQIPGVYFSRIVTSSSARVGWSATVSSNCALVTPVLTAMAMHWIISAASAPTM